MGNWIKYTLENGSVLLLHVDSIRFAILSKTIIKEESVDCLMVHFGGSTPVELAVRQDAVTLHGFIAQKTEPNFVTKKM